VGGWTEAGNTHSSRQESIWAGSESQVMVQAVVLKCTAAFDVFLPV
jgi:hypothetical protein